MRPILYALGFLILTADVVYSFCSYGMAARTNFSAVTSSATPAGIVVAIGIYYAFIRLARLRPPGAFLDDVFVERYNTTWGEALFVAYALSALMAGFIVDRLLGPFVGFIMAIESIVIGVRYCFTTLSRL